ncbi:hypothetical protein ACLMJK_008543 [Lecanora helva]
MTQSHASSLKSPPLDALMSQSPHSIEHLATCCCGREQCAYLEYNTAAIEGLEKDLQNAAKIGQALLARHEAYMAEAEEERKSMGASIERLEGDKRELQAQNAKTIEENRYLLDQLEEMNSTVSNSDAQIISLNNTLLSTRKELERLTVLATQTSQLEEQLAKFEKDQAELQLQLISTEEQERTAVQRCKGAERTIMALQEQVDRIEQEARDERIRHADVVARFEKRRLVEKELDNAAGRLKGAAAATTMGKDGNGNVVSHFVSEILQDNANLQLGIIELREMLMGSNQEVENLREQMMQHHPIHTPPGGLERAESLNSELLKTPTGDATPDLHVHHHYHAAPKVEAREKSSAVRRPKRRRNIPSGFRTPSSGMQTPRTLPASPRMGASSVSTAATILSQTSVTIPSPADPTHSRHWSMESSRPPSSMAPSSLPSSPGSASRTASMFDTIDDVQDSSRPTTPGSMTIGSPTFAPRQSKRTSNSSARSFPRSLGDSTAESSFVVAAIARKESDHSAVNTDDERILEHSTIVEEPEEDSSTRPSTKESRMNDYIEDHFTSSQTTRPRLHRANSHESILSTRNIDIPKLRSKGSQLLTRQGFTPHTSLRTSSTSITPVTSSTSAVAQSSKTSRGYDSSNYNRLLLKNPQSNSTPSAEIPPTMEKSTLGKRMGGWMFGKWGNMPTASTSNLKAKDVLGAVSEKAREGKKAEDRRSTHIEPVSLDDSLLKESLGENLEGRSFAI